MMRRRAKRVREGLARERKKEGKPAYFGAHVEKTRFRRTGLVKSKKATGRSSYTPNSLSLGIVWNHMPAEDDESSIQS